jgi:hypothetical protein
VRRNGIKIFQQRRRVEVHQKVDALFGPHLDAGNGRHALALEQVDRAANLVVIRDGQSHAAIEAMPLDSRDARRAVGIARVDVRVDEQVAVPESGAIHDMCCRAGQAFQPDTLMPSAWKG